MAAPTVGEVMADILPYLGVRQSDSAQAQWVMLEDVTGLSASEAQQKLKAAGLDAIVEGFGSKVVTQVPLSGQTVPIGSQVLLYLGENSENSKEDTI